MKVSELKKDKNLRLEVKKNVPIAVLAQIADSVRAACVKANEDGRLYCDYVSKKLNTEVNLFGHFAGIEFDKENTIAEYDWLVEEGKLDELYSQIDNKSELFELIDAEVNQEIALANSVEASVAKAAVYFINALEILQEKLPTNEQIKDTVKTLSKEMKGLGDLKVLGDLKKDGTN